MTQLSFTSGQIMDIISALEVQEIIAREVGDNHHLASYYLNMMNQFQTVYDRLQDRAGEDRLATLVLAD